MAQQVVPVLQQLHPSAVSQKVQLIQKLFLLENARNTLEQELRSCTNKAYDEVQGFLNSSFPSSVFTDLVKGLDVKCQFFQSVSALLKNFTAESQVDTQPTVKSQVGTNQLLSLRVKKIPVADVLKFGPMLKSSFMANSIAKAVQVLGAKKSIQQLKLFLTSQPASFQQNNLKNTVSSNTNSAILTTVTSCHLKTGEERVVLDESSQPKPEIAPPVIPQTINAERPQLPPPVQVILPEVSKPEPTTITPLTGWEQDGYVQVQHQKQTSSQLLRFFKEKPENMDALEVSVTHWTKSTYASDFPQPMSPTIKTQSYQIRHGVTDDLVDARTPKTLRMNIENQAPVFRVKKVNASGSLIYSCVITSETELWDIGDIHTDVVQQGPGPGPPGRNGCQNIMAQVENSCVNIIEKTESPQCTEADHENIFEEAKTQTCNGVNIPQFQIRRFEETEVVVSHIVNPGDFYIQHADSPEKLQSLITDSWKASSSYAEQNCIPDLGTLVMGWFPEQEQWCRAQVMKICGVSRDKNARNGATSETSIKVEVKRLDHGDTACLSLRNIKELPDEMAVLPLQAIQVSLVNVTPVSGSHWSEESLGWFRAIVHNRMLYARLYPQGPKVTVELFLEKGKLGAMRRSASLSLRLAQNGHAKHDKLKNTGARKISTVQLNAHKQDSDWEKYLISCYTRCKK